MSSFADNLNDCLCETIQARSGEQAFKILETLSVGAVILDIRIGGMGKVRLKRGRCERY